MVKDRSTAARYLSAAAANDDQPLDAAAIPSPELEAVLDFFSMLGYLVAAGAIRAEAAWMNYSALALAYWAASYEYVKSRRNHNPLYWRHYEHLVATMERVEARKRLALDNRIHELSWLPGIVRQIIADVTPWLRQPPRDSRRMDEIKELLAEEAKLTSAASAAVAPQPMLPN